MTLTTEQLSAVETTKEFRALLKYMRAIAKAEPESVKEKFELEEGLWRYASQKAIKAIVGHIDALEFALVANREAQPVMWRYRYRRGPHKGYWTYVGRKSECPTRPFHEIQGLYTAPPAPAVPEEMTGGIAIIKYKIKKSNYVQWVKGWNACRAAVLAQPVSSGYTLPEGFKLVPVEPTEEMLRAAYRESGVYSAKAYHAMLAAAPEGGNDHDTRR